MKIAVLGLGYVGCVTAACLAKDQSNLVYGIDPSEAKVDKINHGLPTVYEPYLDQLYEQLAQTNPIKAFSDLTSINEALDAIYVVVPLDKSILLWICPTSLLFFFKSKSLYCPNSNPRYFCVQHLIQELVPVT